MHRMDGFYKRASVGTNKWRALLPSVYRPSVERSRKALASLRGTTDGTPLAVYAMEDQVVREREVIKHNIRRTTGRSTPETLEYQQANI